MVTAFFIISSHLPFADYFPTKYAKEPEISAKKKQNEGTEERFSSISGFLRCFFSLAAPSCSHLSPQLEV